MTVDRGEREGLGQCRGAIQHAPSKASGEKAASVTHRGKPPVESQLLEKPLAAVYAGGKLDATMIVDAILSTMLREGGML